MIRSTLSLALLLLLASRSSFALQILEAKDGETMLAKISRKEISRISVEHGRIRKVTGNAGEFVLEKDDETGQVFVRPSNIESSKPLNLFVTAEQDTFALLLQPVDTPSETILIRPAAHKRDPATSPVAAGHIRRLKNLLLVMANDARPEEMEISGSNTLKTLWPGTRLVLNRTWRTPEVTGERYTLTNLSSSNLPLEERRFFKAGVMAVSIEHALLTPGASTSLFVIRESGRDD
jgi:conjugal transfer pilus assembly protein TraK